MSSPKTISIKFEPRRQGKSTKQALEKLSRAFKSVADSTRALSETTQAQSDALNAISKHIQNSNEQELKKLILDELSPGSVEEKKMSGTYPIRIESTSLNHKGGTKSYHATLVTNEDGNSLVIFRWGKTGSFGSVKTLTLSAAEASKTFEKKIAEKMSGGYAIDPKRDPTPRKVFDFEELRQQIGRGTMSRLGPKEIRHLDPGVDTRGIKEAEEPHLDEDNRRDPNFEARKRQKMEERKAKARAEAKRQEQLEYDQTYTNNPNFGAF